jgi:hypothetical protein
MLHASTQQLIRTLRELTEAGSLAWKVGDQETSRLETEGYIVEVAPAPPSLRLLRADGRELETATAEDLAGVDWPNGDGTTYATHVARIAARASRIARGAEQPIATVLSSISAPAMKPAVDRTRYQPTALFGESASFAKPPKLEPAAAQPPTEPSPDLLARWISAQSSPATERSAATAIAPPRPPQPSASGPNPYKPWS